MAESDKGKKDKGKKDDAQAREQRNERLQRLLQERSEDAAKMVKTWLQQANEDKK